MKPDAEELLREIKQRYRAVARDPAGQFSYAVGRPSAEALGYDPAWLDAVPAPIVDRFVGVGHPFSLRAPRPGEAVLDAGCGCGLDTFIASSLVVPGGRAVGVDLTADMLDVARAALATSPRPNLELHEGSVEALPFAAGSFDLVSSNGALNLVLDKAAAFRELARVLRPGGTLAVADLLVTETVPDEVLADLDAWSG